MRNPRGFGPGGSCVIHVILSEQSESKDLLAHIGKIPPTTCFTRSGYKTGAPCKGRSCYDLLILIFNRKLQFARIEVFYMKIIMRQVSVIFYSENHGNDNAVRRCLLDKIE